MAVICPTVTAYNLHEYREQLERILPFATRIHIDLMDGEFAPTTSPPIDHLWIPHGVIVDIHLMYRRPMEQLELLKYLNPHMVIIHAEADVHHALFAAEMHKEGIKAGIAFLQDTDIQGVEDKISGFDHGLLFSGHLGHHGGQADLSLLHKVAELKEHHPDMEIGWDGGINEQNVIQLVEGGVEVLNAGSYIQKSPDPHSAYAKLFSNINNSVLSNRRKY